MQSICTILLFFSLFEIHAQTASGFIIQSNEKNFEIKVESTVSYHGVETANIDLFLGSLESNPYQKVHASKFDGETRKQKFGFESDSCFFYQMELGVKKFRKQKVTQEFEITVADIEVNFDRIDSILPYDTTSAIYQAYTTENQPFINPKNKYLTSLSDSIWATSANVLDYARKCYEFVPGNFKYLDPITGFYPLDTIIEKGGGDCGNLESIFITLLRIKGIPARHLVGFRPDNSLHVWSDFYLEGYGWVPVDVTYKQSNPEGDYFGKILFENNGFIVHRGIGHIVFGSRGPMRIIALQTFSYRDSYTRDSVRKVKIVRNLIAKEQ